MRVCSVRFLGSFLTPGLNLPKMRCAGALDMSTEDCARITAVSADPSTSPWVVSNTANEGSTSLRSGAVGDDRGSCTMLTLALPINSVISVAARTSSQGGFDQLQIIADNLRLDTLSAPVSQSERDWRQQSYFLPEIHLRTVLVLRQGQCRY